MPYIVTTKRHLPYGHAVQTRRAVATLEEARTFAEQGLHDATYRSDHLHGWLEPLYEIRDLPESGGTVGPLPDGTVIEVERVTWRDIARDGPFDYAIAMVWAVQAMDGKAEPQARLIDAFNAAQS